MQAAAWTVRYVLKPIQLHSSLSLPHARTLGSLAGATEQNRTEQHAGVSAGLAEDRRSYQAAKNAL